MFLSASIYPSSVHETRAPVNSYDLNGHKTSETGGRL